MPKLSKEKTQQFRKVIWEHYRKYKRRLPWRETTNPYHVVVSEIMLQQTQVDRVKPKYAEFIKKFPDFASLARGSSQEVLRLWQGLGYNRRALALHNLSKEVIRRFGRTLPSDPAILIELPGIGPGTAGAIAAFAFNKPVTFIETNIRRAFIHYFFPNTQQVSDEQILPLIAATISRTRARHWYYALMDYGSHLRQLPHNPNARSQTYRRQSTFSGSNRQLRGKIIRLLLHEPRLSDTQIVTRTAEPLSRIQVIVKSLEREGFITRAGKKYQLL
jgi:A/G-specific adenine glycosylase